MTPTAESPDMYSTLEFNQPELEDFLQEDQYFKTESYYDKKEEDAHFRTSFYNPFEIKHRKRTSRAQFKILEKTFLENPKPNAAVRRWLAQQLVMTPRGVQVWFQNRRAKEKSSSTKKPTKESWKKKQIKIDDSPVESICTCSDCQTPMSRTLSLEDDQLLLTPLVDQPSFDLYQPNRKPSPWFQLPFLLQTNSIMKRPPTFYNPNVVYSQPMNESSELFRRLSEPIFGQSSYNFDLNDL